LAGQKRARPIVYSPCRTVQSTPVAQTGSAFLQHNPPILDDFAAFVKLDVG
jgi:hypothetical protein